MNKDSFDSVIHSLECIDNSELMLISGGSFGFDVGAVLGWLVRSQSFGPGNPAGVIYANCIWHYQYSN